MRLKRNEEMDFLFQAILTLENEAECRAFWADLCTVREQRDMVQRLQVARLLRQGIKYSVISREIGVSSATISRVSRCLSGTRGGYAGILSRLEENDQEIGEDTNEYNP